MPPASPAPPSLGRYELRGKIADGGMASVYVAQRDGQLVALKMIREDFVRNAEFLEMFLDEAKILSCLRHPNIVSVQEAGGEGGQAFIAMADRVDNHLIDTYGCQPAPKTQLTFLKEGVK